MKSNFISVAKKILMIAVPVSLCSVISAINRIVDTATITRGIETAFMSYIPAHTGVAVVINPIASQLNAEAFRLLGMLAKSDTLINLPLALNIALATVLVPSIPKCNAEKKDLMIKKYITSSLLTSVVLIFPVLPDIILAKPIYNLIYPNASNNLQRRHCIFKIFSGEKMAKIPILEKVYMFFKQRHIRDRENMIK